MSLTCLSSLLLVYLRTLVIYDLSSLEFCTKTVKDPPPCFLASLRQIRTSFIGVLMGCSLGWVRNEAPHSLYIVFLRLTSSPSKDLYK